MNPEKIQKFSKKHGPGTVLDPSMREKIEKIAKNGEVACAVAFQTAADLEVSSAEIGQAIDLLELKLSKCQLGLFGYRPQKKNVKPKLPENMQIQAAIRETLVDGKLTCADAWDIAKRFKVPKMTISGACEALHIKIKPCQLGAF